MNQETTKILLERLPKIAANVDAMRDDMQDILRSLTAIESTTAKIRGTFDHMEATIGRIERRLGLDDLAAP